MKTIGLIGGMSWQSTRTYYDALNEAVAERLGGLHSAEIEELPISSVSRRSCGVVTGVDRTPSGR